MGHGACLGEMRNVHKVSAGKSKGERPLGRLGRRCWINIRMYLRYIGWEGVE
jgi:hypothetical protein